VVYLRRPLRFWNGFGFPEVLVLMSMIGPFITSELNGDLIRYGSLTLPSVGHYDALSAVVAEFLLLLPFFLGRQVLKNAPNNAEIFHVLVVAGLIYSLLMLFELRMSPQLHFWVYGYYPSDFVQAVREGGFRPVVFVGHGLAVAFFTMTTVVAATTIWRLHGRVLRLPAAGITAYLSMMLILCKSGAALAYGVTLASLVRWTSPRLQLRVAMILVTIALIYPLLRSADLIPTATILDMVGSISADRADSLKTRFDQEHQLLDHASKRILFGWGRFGRNRVYDINGKDISVTDGLWIITIGEFGLFGFLAEFGLLSWPIFRAAAALRFTESTNDSVLLAALALILAINIFDLLPNSGLTPWTWLLAGALLGRAEALHAAARATRLTNTWASSTSRAQGVS
jgi:hypothetical protein